MEVHLLGKFFFLYTCTKECNDLQKSEFFLIDIQTTHGFNIFLDFANGSSDLTHSLGRQFLLLDCGLQMTDNGA